MSLLASNSGPMLGSLTADRWSARMRRHDRPGAAYGRIQLRDARRAERELLASDLASEADEAPITTLDLGLGSIRLDLGVDAFDIASADLDALSRLLDEYNAEDAAWDAAQTYHSADDLDPDDFDWADALADAAALLRDADDDFWTDVTGSAWDLPGSPGWGEARVDYSEYVSGFSIRSRP